jgi:hypothetical protein
MLSAEEIRSLDRRQFLHRFANGFAGMSLAGVLGGCQKSLDSDLLLPPSAPAPAAKAKSVIFLYMAGAPSQLDTFDPKPRLAKEHGQDIKLKLPQIQFNSCTRVLMSPFSFAKYGQCGADVSDIFPHLAQCVDDLCFVRSMVSEHGEHGTANFYMNTGSAQQGRPGFGSWVSYGLGRACDDLPSFVVLESGRMVVGGRGCFSNGFLPADHQGSVFQMEAYPVPDIRRREATAQLQRAKLDLIGQLEQQRRSQWGVPTELDTVIENYETAFRMQSSVPSLLDTSDESQTTLASYGIGEKYTNAYGTQCLLARKLVERGVRFVQLLPPKLPEHDQWDQHERLAEGHRDNAQAIDKPIAALLKDLKARGLLDQTIVLWGGEFGRTAMEHTMPAGSRSCDGRGHNRFGFTMWMAGGGFKPGTIYGATDEYGFFAVENPVSVHDLHATILHQLGLNHEQLTYRYAGRDFRLTDVAGQVVRGILA